VREHLLAQDVIFVSGGSVVNLLAVWRAHRLDEILRECWEAGVVLAGESAGSMCWHLGGLTDSFRDALDPVTNGLGFLPFSNGVPALRRHRARRGDRYVAGPPGLASGPGQ
jgi:peptidase E